MRNRRTAIFFIFVVFFAVACAVGASPRISATEGKQKVAAGALLVDVRSPDEYAAGHVIGAKNVPHTEVDRRLSEFGEDKLKEIVLYCGSGRRASLAQAVLNAHGYRRVYNGGGFNEW